MPRKRRSRGMLAVMVATALCLGFVAPRSPPRRLLLMTACSQVHGAIKKAQNASGMNL
jgi:hypothetical protein